MPLTLTGVAIENIRMWNSPEFIKIVSESMYMEFLQDKVENVGEFMNINNFNEFIDKKILNRGYDYYLDGTVELLDNDNNRYLLQVQGTYLYEVSVVLDDNDEIISSQYNCPYNLGPICKHEVAAYYELNKILKCKEDCINIKKEKQPSLIDVLDKLSKEELVNLIIKITNNDMVLKNNILLLYSKDRLCKCMLEN